MIKILSNKRTVKSARLLSECMSNLSGERFIVTINPYKINSSPFVRFGNSSYVDDSYLCVNSSEFIKLSSNKLIFSELMMKNNIFSPIFINNRHPHRDEYPVMIRKTLRGYGGKGIYIVENEDDFFSVYSSNYYWTRFINLKSEYRIHVLGGKVARIFKKLLINEGEKNPIRNSKSCHFSIRENFKKFEKIITFIENDLTLVLNGDFYGLDIGLDYDNNIFVIECNSAPGMENINTRIMYARYILKRIEEIV